MPVEKRQSKSARYRASLAENIEKNGFVVMPCTWCATQNLTCRMLPKVKRCSACVQRGRSCDGSGVPISQLDRIMQEQRRIEREERDTEESLEATQRKLEEEQRALTEHLSRLRRLRQQKKFLVDRGADMVARGLSTLDDLEEAERQEALAATGAPSSEGVPNSFVDPSSGFDWSLGNPLAGVDPSAGFPLDCFNVPEFLFVFRLGALVESCVLRRWFQKRDVENVGP
ncbi:hypothetical protein CHGG_04275 [Chaetomium globosum CBS 148.51]|uniref:Zn(2)-C6 fungal-type domain-containing protein n=1 Tax=Chaetomium globosum (strain ATCC 6205 / CBS 148.51 / DSM 1962 / NBRC 6347 / NRRL 1970) TaxID=306901 RepID=Q2H1S1_CHAGB|nr:uncharacterized protein CHGG_04275 [Chaetomium globosum CBS 148.51]EAQ87656.1 hypothetical protein CHGG_04275 [Chaetomium globosum CBS 148.51]